MIERIRKVCIGIIGFELVVLLLGSTGIVGITNYSQQSNQPVNNIVVEL